MNTKRTRRGFGIAALILSFAVALTGCSTSNFASTSSAGFPPGAAGDVSDVPSAHADSTSLYITIGGSSSCPPAPTSMLEVNGVPEIAITSNTEGPCTADFVVTTHQISIDKVPAEVVLVFNGDERQTLTVKRL